jgi:hypothetical protein
MAQSRVPFHFSIDDAPLDFKVVAASVATTSTVTNSNGKIVTHSPPYPTEQEGQASQSPAIAATQSQCRAGEGSDTQGCGVATTTAQRTSEFLPGRSGLRDTGEMLTARPAASLGTFDAGLHTPTPSCDAAGLGARIEGNDQLVQVCVWMMGRHPCKGFPG